VRLAQEVASTAYAHAAWGDLLPTNKLHVRMRLVLRRICKAGHGLCATIGMFSTIANAEQPVTTATLKVLPVALAAALSVLATPPVHATATVPAASNIRQAPGFFRLHVGRFEVTALLDGTHPFPATKLATGARPGEVEGENTGNKRGHGSAGSTGLKMGQSC